ncbi:hypothetical protein SK128_014601 [Halocaridina rubra]|uniref:ENPP1-3/EXOG-like endonuclease/phosphodiesterase domain-containing protein n=1 Tax=Halocaridina rubra TaxID=373956 RepID=A0AAN8XJ24_HALRR
MPLWTSFSFSTVSVGTVPSLWSSDVRLTASTTAACAEYDSLLPLNISMGPLFPPETSVNASLEHIPFMVSNAIPTSDYLNARWKELVAELIPNWVVSQGPLNVIMGPLFDNDADSHVDNFTQFSTPEVPSDLFAVVTRCEDPVTSIDLCSPASLDVASFIYPQSQPVSNCLHAHDYALLYSAKVHDVELATGLTFYPDLPFEDRTRVTLRINSELWRTDKH